MSKISEVLAPAISVLIEAEKSLNLLAEELESQSKEIDQKVEFKKAEIQALDNEIRSQREKLATLREGELKAIAESNKQLQIERDNFSRIVAQENNRLDTLQIYADEKLLVAQKLDSEAKQKINQAIEKLEQAFSMAQIAEVDKAAAEKLNAEAKKSLELAKAADNAAQVKKAEITNILNQLSEQRAALIELKNQIDASRKLESDQIVAITVEKNRLSEQRAALDKQRSDLISKSAGILLRESELDQIRQNLDVMAKDLSAKEINLKNDERELKEAYGKLKESAKAAGLTLSI